MKKEPHVINGKENLLRNCEISSLLFDGINYFDVGIYI